MSRPYRQPSEHQIYTSEGKLISLDAWRDRYRPKPDQIAKESDIGRAVSIAIRFLIVAGVLWAILRMGGHA